MSFFRNEEIKNQLIIYSVFSSIAFIGALFINLTCAIYVLLICVISEITFLYWTKKRYNSIANLTYRLEQILHSNEFIDFIVDKEGEIAILSNSIYKMTVKLREQAERLQKDKNYLKSFIEDISHQIRTPMTSIKIIISRLSKDSMTEEERIENVREINSLLSRIEWLVTAILDVAKLESGTALLTKENVDIKELIDKSLEPLRIQLDIKDINLILNIETDSNYIGDFYWGVEAIENILKNCIEHSNDGGTIEVIAKKNQIFTEIIIFDNGKGIPEENLPHLFERFYSGTGYCKLKESIGIGLFLTKTIITKQNGVIMAKNRDSGGAEFHIKFYHDNNMVPRHPTEI